MSTTSRYFLAIMGVLSMVPTGYAQSQTKTFDHPLGIRLEYPASWQLQVDETTGEPALIPDDANLDQDGQPLEAFGFAIFGAPNVERPEELAGMYDELYATIMPFLRRTIPPEAAAHVLGPGAVFTYEGDYSGWSFRQTVHVILHEGLIVHLSYFGASTAVEERDAITKSIFAGVSRAQRRIDQKLVGSWEQRESDVSNSYSGEYVASSTSVRWVFSEDGTCRHEANSSIGGSVGGFALNSGSDDTEITRCAWAADRDLLHVAWLSADGGGEAYRYSHLSHAGEPALMLQAPEEEPVIFR